MQRRVSVLHPDVVCWCETTMRAASSSLLLPLEVLRPERVVAADQTAAWIALDLRPEVASAVSALEDQTSIPPHLLAAGASRRGV